MKNDGLSVPQGAALTLGAVLGTGVISLPALAASEAGPAEATSAAGSDAVSPDSQPIRKKKPPAKRPRPRPM